MPDQPQTIYARLSVWALSVASASTWLLLALLTLPFHLLAGAHRMQEHEMRGPWVGDRFHFPPGASTPPPGLPSPGVGAPMLPPPGFMEHHAAYGAGLGLFGVALVIVGITLWGGLAGALVAVIYNALLPKEKTPSTPAS